MPLGESARHLLTLKKPLPFLRRPICLFAENLVMTMGFFFGKILLFFFISDYALEFKTFLKKFS